MRAIPLSEGTDSVIQVEGRKLLGDLMSQLKISGISVGKRTKFLPDGTQLIARYDGTTPSITAIAPTSGVSTETEPLKVALWVPRGFVVYPASDTSANGWGLPAIAAGGFPLPGPYDAINLAPGLDVTRWTAGGALGQVLLTTDAHAGYPKKPTDLIPPLLFSDAAGLRLKQPWKAPSTSVLAAYRIEFVDFDAQSPSASASEAVLLKTNKRHVFEAVNAHRVSIGRTPMHLSIRGLHDSAQTTAEIMHATHTLGHYSERFPPTYRTYPDRQSKDGFRAFVAASNATSRNKPGASAENQVASGTATSIGTDPNGISIDNVVPGTDVSGSQAITSWFGSPVHMTIIESADWDAHFATTSVGFKHAFAAQHFVHNNQWIECGNRQFNSKHVEIPTLSWFGFASLNLGWETWPCSFNDDIANHTQPPDPLTILTPLDLGGGQFWLRYFYAKQAHPTTAPFASNTWVPALDSRIFMRGRSIAIIPRGGWVWAAAIQKFDSPDSDALNVYRLVALAHHEDDQPVGNKINGMTRQLRVWWCDLPNKMGLPANPQAPIRGVYGLENEGWPWDAVNSPTSWRDGGLVDVGTSDGSTADLLKYASQWVFSSDGMKAICLRDHGEYADFGTLWTDSDFGLFAVTTGKLPTALELTFGGNAFNPLTVTKEWLGAPAGATAQAYAPVPGWFIQTFPVAAGYDAADVRSYCMSTSVVNPIVVHVGDDDVYRSSFLFTGAYDYAPANTTDGTIYSSVFSETRYGNVPHCDYLAVLDVTRKVALAAGAIQRFSVPIPGGSVAANPDFEPCWLTTSSPAVKVTVWVDGVQQNTRSFDNRNGSVMTSWFALCWQTDAGNYYAGTRLPLSINNLALPSFAVNRDGDWVACYTVTPQPGVTYAASTTSSDCSVPGQTAWFCTPTLAADFSGLAENVADCRGGWMGASFADEAALTALTATPGSNARLLYARAA